MIPAGYMAKRVQKPKGLNIDHVLDVYSVSSHVSDDFADYINYWKHNGYWLFDSPQTILELAAHNSIDLNATSLFYYEVYEKEFDGERWQTFGPQESLPTNVNIPSKKTLDGFDVVTFWARTSPECSPLSCNGLASDLSVNSHCLLASFDEAYKHVNDGAFNNSEPGPYRIFAIYSVDWPELS